MTLCAAIGKAQGLDATEAAVQATDQALSQVGRARVAIAFVAASDDYPPHQVVNGVSGLLSDTPLLGFSTPYQLTNDGISQRSITVALLIGDDVQTRADFWTGYSEDSGQCTRDMLESLNLNDREPAALLIFADGLNADSAPMVEGLPRGNYALAGCLAGGDLTNSRAYQIGGMRCGNHGLAAALLHGNIKVGVGTNHGWQSIGIYSRITRSKNLWVRTLDGRRPTDTYSRYFGHQARDWSYPPLNHLVRLYPLGVERDGIGESGQPSFLVRSPLRVETDGSLRMNAGIPQGKSAYLLVSSAENCLAAARIATQQALEGLGGRRPVLALVFADIAWNMLLQAQPGSEIAAIQSILGEDIPILGGYCYGQVGRGMDEALELFNQHIQIVLFGD